ncbi:hypothetical protein [Pseudomonas sp. HY13-MNA-CIBAN-0226]|uniref:hypothetical protein n=1 Tax=Pseudomonas sp. HY13-MNA-CIBAN-0226 TaxID=3140473 RepID=UPI00332B9C4C
MPLGSCEQFASQEVLLQTSTAKPRKIEKMEKPMQPKEGRRTDTATKPRRDTIGVTTKKSFHSAVATLARSRGVAIAALTRDLLQDGIDRFECEMESNNPSSLLRSYEQAATSYDGSETEHWVIRVDRPLAKLVRMTATEFEKSTSQITSFLLAESMRHVPSCDKAKVRDAISENAFIDESSVEDVAREILSVMVPKKSRELAQKVGLRDRRDVLCVVLMGEMLAPSRVVDAVAEEMDVPAGLLMAATRFNFEHRQVPAFKSPSGKPQMLNTPRTWREGISALKLPESEESWLFGLEN